MEIRLETIRLFQRSRLFYFEDDGSSVGGRCGTGMNSSGGQEGRLRNVTVKHEFDRIASVSVCGREGAGHDHPAGSPVVLPRGRAEHRGVSSSGPPPASPVGEDLLSSIKIARIGGYRCLEPG